MLPTKEQIEKRAYEIYLARGCEDGDAVDDWLAAEMQVLFEMNWPQGGHVNIRPQKPGDSSLV